MSISDVNNEMDSKEGSSRASFSSSSSSTSDRSPSLSFKGRLLPDVSSIDRQKYVIVKSIFAYMTQLSYKGRKNMRREMAVNVINAGMSMDSIDWRHFALMQCPGIIRETSLEGHSARACIQKAINFFTQYKQESNYYFYIASQKNEILLEITGGMSHFFYNPEITKPIVDDILTSLNQMKRYIDFWPSQTNAPLSIDAISKSIHFLLRDFQIVFSRLPPGKKEIYFPLGYRAGKENEAHMMAFKLVENGDKIEIHLFNLGNGTSLHPIMEYTLHSKKRSYKFYPIWIRKDLFYSEIGQKLFAPLWRYMSEPPDSVPYDALDTYDVLFQIANRGEGAGFLLDFGSKQKDLGEEEQVSGNCSEVAVFNVRNDVLLCRGVSKVARRKLHLNILFSSLCQHYRDYVKDPKCHPSASTLLNEAVKTLGTEVRDLQVRGLIFEQEFAAATAVLGRMSKVIAKTSGPLLLEMQNSNRDGVQQAQSSFLLATEESQKVDEESVVANTVVPYDPPLFDSSKLIKTQLEEWFKVALLLPSEEAFSFVSNCIQQLPIPNNESSIKEAHASGAAVSDFWDTVPIDQITSSLKILQDLVRQGLKGIKVAETNKNNVFLQQFMMINTAKAITDKLARRCKETKLEGYGTTLLPIKLFPGGFTSLPLKEENERFTRLEQYFSGSKLPWDEITLKYVLFPVSKVIDVHKYLISYLSGQFELDDIIGVNQVRYLAQFLSSPKDANAISFYQKQWSKALPPQVQILYYFTLLSNVLFLSIDKEFPQELTFQETIVDGRLGLEIPNVELAQNGKLSQEEPHYDHRFTQVGFPNRKEITKSSKPDEEVLQYIQQKFNCSERAVEAMFSQNSVTRWPERGCLGQREWRDPFLDFFNLEIAKLTTNAGLCFSLSPEEGNRWGGISEIAIRLLLNISRCSNLSFFQVLHEFLQPENYTLLHIPAVQEIIESCIFKAFYLLDHLEHVPDSAIESFRAFIDNGLKKNLSLQSMLFILRLGICFETFTPDSKSRNETISSYRNFIRDKQRTALSKSLMLYDVLLISIANGTLSGWHRADSSSDFSIDEVVHVFKVLFEAPLVEPTVDSEWIRNILPQLMQRNAYRYFNLLKDEKIRNAICNAIMANLSIESYAHSSKNWQGSFPQFICGDIAINFSMGTITHLKKGILAVDDKEQFALFWVDKEGRKLALDGSKEYCPTRKTWFQLVTTATEKVKRREITFYSPEEAKKLGLPFIYLKGYKVYLDEKGIFTFCDRESEKPFLIISRNRDRYTRVDAEGRALPLVRKDLSVSTSSDSFPHTLRIEDPQYILCFTNLKGDVIEELYYHRFHAQFVRDSKGLHYNSIKGSYLITNVDDLNAFEDASNLKQMYAQVLREMNHFNLAFVLYIPDNKEWIVVMPRYNLTQGAEDFSTKVFGTYPADIWIKETRMSFRYDEVEGVLKVLPSEQMIDFSPDLYLVLLFKIQRDYVKALRYLNKVDHFKTYLLEIINDFINLKDFSAQSLAFNLKFLLALIETNNYLTEERLTGRKKFPIIKYMKWGMNVYNLYLQLINETGSGKIPAELRITEEEQKVLLLAFRNYYRDTPSKNHQPWQETWSKDQPLLCAHFGILFSHERAVTIRPDAQEIALSSPVFKFVDEPENLMKVTFCIFDPITESIKKGLIHSKTIDMRNLPIRVSHSELANNFVQLFEIARSSDPRAKDTHFDFLLHALLKSRSNPMQEKAAPIASVLFWVRHFSHLFQDPFFSLTDDIGKKVLGVVIQVSQIPSLDPVGYEKFKREFLSRKHVHQADNMRLNIPPPQNFSELCPERTKRFGAEGLLKLPLEELEKQLMKSEKQMQLLFNSQWKRDGLSQQDVHKEFVFILELVSEQILTSSMLDRGKLPETLMKYVNCKNDLMYLNKHRSMLNDVEKQEITHLVSEWYYIRVLMMVKEKRMEHSFVDYDYQRFPEISCFMIKTKKVLTAEQLSTYQWVEDGILSHRHRHFKLPAGAGKTEVLTPLMVLGATKWGLMPVIMVTKVSYPLDRTKLQYHLSIVGENLAYLEIDMYMINTLSAFELEFIYSQLEHYRTSGTSLLLTQQTLYALFHIRMLALKLGTEETNAAIKQELGNKIRWSSKILQFFKRECVLVCDESDQNADQMTRSIFGFDEFLGMPINEGIHLLELRKISRGRFTKDVPGAKEVLAAKAEYEKKPVEKGFEAFKVALAKCYIHLMPEISAKDHDSVIAWWTDRRVKAPEFLNAWGKERRNLACKMIVTRKFLLIHLPDILGLKTGEDHDRSPFLEREHEVPAHFQLVSTAEYGDHYKTCLLTIDGYYDRGLKIEDFKNLINFMKEKHKKELQTGACVLNNGDTPTNLIFKKWLMTCKEKTDIESLNDIIPDRIQDVFDLLKHNLDLIDYFLVNKSFVGIGSTTSQFNFTVTDIFNNFPVTISFSATPLHQLAYPRVLARGSNEDFREEGNFRSKVRNKLLEPQNSTTIILPEDVSSSNCFEFMKKTYPEIWDQATVIIDPRSFLPGNLLIKNAKDWLRLNPKLDGVIFIKSNKIEGDVDKIARMDTVQIYIRGDSIPYGLNSTDVQQSLARLNIPWDRSNIGVIFDSTHTQSFHIALKQDAKALFFVDEGLMDEVQPSMRMRGLLDKNQTITWVYPSRVARKIVKGEDVKSLCPQMLFGWIDESNAKPMEEKRILLNAFSEIFYAISKQARDEINDAIEKDQSPHMSSSLEVSKKYKGGFIERNVLDAYLSYGDSEVLTNIREVLLSYAARVYEKFNYSRSLKSNEALMAKITEIIEEIEKLIPETYGNANQEISKSIELHMQIKTHIERDQEVLCPRKAIPASLAGKYGDIHIWSPEYLELPRRDIHCEVSKFLTKDFYFLQNQIITATVYDNTHPVLNYSKPIHFFNIVVTVKGDQYVYFADVNSNDIVSSHVKDLQTCPDVIKGLRHKAFILTVDGQLVRNGRGALAVPAKVVKQIQESEWFLNLRVDAALLKGRIIHPEIILKRIRQIDEEVEKESHAKPGVVLKSGWEEFESLWKDIVRGLPNKDQAHTAVFEWLKGQARKTALQ